MTKATQSDECPDELTEIVMQQVCAYNDHDIDSFCSTYDERIVLYWHPDEIRTEGMTALREQYSRLFRECPEVKAEVVYQNTIGNKVLLEERISGYFGKPAFSAFVIYEVSNGLIQKVWFITGVKLPSGLQEHQQSG